MKMAAGRGKRRRAPTNPAGPFTSRRHRQLIHGEMDDQVHPDHTMRLADRLIAADKDFELLIVPGAEHVFIDHLAYIRKRCWDFLVHELIGTQPPSYRPAPIAIGPELLSELFA